MSHYAIVRTNSIEDLEREVQKFLSKDWEVIGGPFHFQRVLVSKTGFKVKRTTVHFFNQAMISK